MKTIAWTLTLLAGLPLALSAEVTKEDLKKLAAAGISDEVILSYVRANGPVAKLSADDVIDLKQAGASEKVLSVALGNAPAPAPAYTPAPAPRQSYTAPATTTVYDTTPYYYQPSVSYAAYVATPVYYPSSYYYDSYYPRYYSTCYPRTYYSSYSTRYCAPRYGVSVGFGSSYCSPHYGVSVGFGTGYHSSRGSIGVSGYRRH